MPEASHPAEVTPHTATELPVAAWLEGEFALAAPGQVVLVADAQMRYVAASHDACRLLGYAHDELLTMRVPDLVIESDAPARYSRMIERGTQRGRVTLVCKDGRRVEALYSAREASGPGDPLYYVSYLTPLNASEASAAPTPKKTRLVIADDDPAMRMLISTLVPLGGGVEVVAEAADGEDAVRLVQRHDPDLVLLDVQMPRLDGLATAEVIRSLRPYTHVVLYSGAATEEMKRHAEAMGLRLLDKMNVDQVVETIVHRQPAEVSEVPDPQIEAAVLTALTTRGTAPVVIVCADGSVPFYNTLAADLLGLPLPVRRTDIDTARKHYQVLRPDDHAPVDPDDRPLTRSANQREPITETLILSRREKQTVCRFTSLPFFDKAGTFTAAALYIQPVATLG